IGGPGASGIMIVRKAAVSRARPVFAGGGTVNFVSPWGHDYSTDIAAREEAGTPNVLGDLRAALAILVKQAIGQHFMDEQNRLLRSRALATWRDNPMIEIVGGHREGEGGCDTLPIFSL